MAKKRAVKKSPAKKPPVKKRTPKAEPKAEAKPKIKSMAELRAEGLSGSALRAALKSQGGGSKPGQIKRIGNNTDPMVKRRYEAETKAEAGTPTGKAVVEKVATTNSRWQDSVEANPGRAKKPWKTKTGGRASSKKNATSATGVNKSTKKKAAPKVGKTTSTKGAEGAKINKGKKKKKIIKSAKGK